MTVADLVEALKAARAALLQAASVVSPERSVLRSAGEEWSVIEVLAHLIDTDYHYMAEALAMRNDSSHMLVYFDDVAWKDEHAGIRDTPLADVLMLLTESHDAVLRSVASLGDDDLGRPGLHPRGIAYTVRDVFMRLPAHDENHTRQIQEIVAAINSNA
jgi:hypothetical protein